MFKEDFTKNYYILKKKFLTWRSNLKIGKLQPLGKLKPKSVACKVLISSKRIF